MKNIEWIDGNHKDVLLSALEKHKPFKRFYTYFDMVNFWLLDYPYTLEHSPYGILESWDGTVLGIYSINCGYGGVGPGSTARLLTVLGISEETAEKWKWQSGIEIHFDQNGNVTESHLGSVFESRAEKNPEILLSDAVSANHVRRTLTFINPQLNRFDSLGAALRYCKTEEFFCYYGSRSQDYLAYHDFLTTTHRYNGKYSIYDLTKGGYVLVRGKQFDVLVLASPGSVYSTIQHLHYLLFSEPYFFENHIGNLIVYSRTQYQDTWFDKARLIHTLLFAKYEDRAPDSKIITKPFRGRKDVFTRL